MIEVLIKIPKTDQTGLIGDGDRIRLSGELGVSIGIVFLCVDPLGFNDSGYFFIHVRMSSGSPWFAIEGATKLEVITKHLFNIDILNLNRLN